MSLVQLRIELPAYAHSFIIDVPPSSTVLDVKQHIFQSCIGAPRIDGQRLVWRGRYLLDAEKVEELWKSPDEPRVIHLAVHPSAWSSTPPTPELSQPQPPSIASPIPQQTIPRPRFSMPLPQQSFSMPLPQQTIQFPNLPGPHPLAFILHKHQTAIEALLSGGVNQIPPISDPENARTWACQVLERHGWQWPPILDQEFPLPTEGGLIYTQTVIQGQSYLSLVDSSAKPTALQTHAINVLSYTFPLLALPIQHTVVTRIPPSHTVPLPPPNINQVLQQLGLPPLRAGQHPNPNPIPNQNGLIPPELRDMPLRPLVAPLLMLVFRTLLLLYFVAPARKPIFGILIVAWMLYEVWQPIRNGLLRGLRQQAAQNQAQAVPGRPNPPGAAAAGQDAPQGPRPAANPQGGVGGAQQIDNQAAAIMETLGNLNIRQEDQILQQGRIDEQEPSVGHKIYVFISLLITTIHPAVWNRRRTALQRREGRIRTEANIRTSEPSQEVEGEDEASRLTREAREAARARMIEQYERQPGWIRRYMDRVVEADWVDDAD